PDGGLTEQLQSRPYWLLRGPLGGETAAHTAPWVRLRSWHIKFTVCIKSWT
ncbi:hypothetical protein E2562_036261, partial [Oryza meyeriana var. granulata]